MTPSPADMGALRARVTSHRDVFARLAAGKFAEMPGEAPEELTVTEADVPAGNRRGRAT